MTEDEVMGFEITDQDLDDEINIANRRPRQSKNQAIYGIWAEHSDSDGDEDARPTFTGGRSRGAKSNYTAPVGFVSAGIQQAGKKKPEEEKEDEEDDEEKSDASSDEGFGRPARGFGFKGKRSTKKVRLDPEGQIAGLRTTGYKPNTSLGKGFGDWEKHTRGIGAKLLLQMGYEAGKGLGKNLQGRNTIVEAHLRKGRGAIGAYGKEGGRPKLQVIDSEEEEEKEFKEKLHQWKKGGKAKNKVKYVYKSVDEVLEEGKWRKINMSADQSNKVKVIDMTGKEQRVLSGYHAIGAQKQRPDEEVMDADAQPVLTGQRVANFDIPELRHNLNMLVDMCEEDLITADRKLRHHKDRVEVLQNEEEKLSELVDKERDQIRTLEEVLTMIERLEARHESNELGLESALAMFKKMKEDYPTEYRIYELPYIATTIVVPLIKTQLTSWSVLAQTDRFKEDFSKWKDVLCLDHQYSPDSEMDPYHNLLWEAWMPSVRVAVNTWSSRNPDAMINFLQSWSELVPPWIAANIREQLILPKLQADVERWDPLTDPIPIHSWLHPWLPIMGQHLEIVYPTIRNKLASALGGWHPTDKSAKLILLPWKDVFSKGSMHTFVIKNIVPKLEMSLQNLIINPHQQMLDEWKAVMDWQDFVNPAILVTMLDKLFFPKWLQVLAHWLNSPNPNYDEITKWYKGWKTMLPQEIIEHEQVKQQLDKALEMMSHSVSMAHPTAMPHMDSVRYLREKATPPPPPPPPPEDIQGYRPFGSVGEAVKTASQLQLGFKEILEKRCEERGIIFLPLSTSREGKQIYRCGNKQIYWDRNVIFACQGQIWVPVSLNNLLDTAKF